ncbi:WD40-repeat-containing domain protein [Suillus discolor]|uniref:WD40-repeat-containing domain protein n=1 Tax=Suillus discolor TaxID=1912936 RepID=A0A9P7EQW4_9AGAM|nr:WD40-repeat-containing domain protein [Suillus discolor]KAG2079559.1 WD40-repeat-containing domain protein [Suillus discolor]
MSACGDGQVYFWSAPTGSQLGSPLRAHSDAISLLAISPDGELIASASRDHTVRLWSTSTRKPFGRVLQHASEVATVAFSPDGQLVATGDVQNVIFLWDISQESTIMTNAVSPSFVSPASNITSYIDQPLASSDSLSTPASDELPHGTEFTTERVGSRDAATSPSPSLPPQSHSNHEITTPARSSLAVELSDRIQVLPDTVNSRASTPVLTSHLKSFWKRFPMFNRSAASVDSKRWKFSRIGSIMRRKHRNVEPDDVQH